MKRWHQLSMSNKTFEWILYYFLDFDSLYLRIYACALNVQEASAIASFNRPKQLILSWGEH